MAGTAQSVLGTFLGAFSRLDLDAMLECVAEEATAFLPTEHARTRLDGRRAIGEAFAAIITRLRAAGATSVPLDLEDLAVMEWDEAAVATFHMRSDHLSRRTFVLHCRAGHWQVVHIHASNAALAD
jgi:ketosteroid isomerase-like protein